MSACFLRAFSRRTPVIALCFIISFSCPLFAQEAEDDTEKKEADIIITATRDEAERLAVPQFVTTITASEIASSGKESVPEIVASQAGAALYDYGHRGSLEQVWLRGATGTRVLVLIDGVPTNNALDGQMSLSLVPAGIIDRIEIVQGGMSILYGSSAVGGVINIITKKGDKLDSFFSGSFAATSYLPQEYTSGGSTLPPQAGSLFDGTKTSLAFGHNFGFLSFFLSGSFDWARNEYYYPDGATVAQRVNAGLLGGDAFAGLAFPWETGALSMSASYVRCQVGSPGSLAMLSPNAMQTDERIQAIAAYHESNLFTNVLSLDVKLSFTHQTRFYEDPGVYADASALKSIFAELEQEFRPVEFLSFIYGGNLSADVVSGTAIGDRTRTAGSFFLSAPLSIAGTFNIYPAGRLDLYSDFGLKLVYGLGMSLFTSDVSSLKLSFSTSFRAPTLSELYYPYMSNPALAAEDGLHFDLGFSLKDKHISLESALFFRSMSNEIKYYAPLYIPENIDQSLYLGGETQAEIEFVENFFINAAYTFIASFDLAGGRTIFDDRRVPLVPLHEAHVYLCYKNEVTAIRLGVDLQSDRYTDATLSRTLPPHVILNANYRQKLASFLLLTLALDNILNTPYQLADGYPMPGISLRWGLEFNF